MPVETKPLVTPKPTAGFPPPPMRNLWPVVCKSVFLQNEAVRVVDPKVALGPDGTTRVHDCQRPVTTVVFETKGKMDGETHPKVSFTVASLEPLLFEPGREYKISVE